MRWSVSVQRELPGQWVVEGAYVASRSYDLTTDFNLNPVPRSTCRTQQRARHGHHQLPDRDRAESVRGSAAGRDAQRRTRSASSCCGRSRSSRTSTRAATTDRARFDSAQFRLDEALQGRLHGRRELHVVGLQGEGHAAQRHRPRLRRAASTTPTCRTASSSTASGNCRSAGPEVRAATRTRSSTACIGNWSVSFI